MEGVRGRGAMIPSDLSRLREGIMEMRDLNRDVWGWDCCGGGPFAKWFREGVETEGVDGCARTRT